MSKNISPEELHANDMVIRRILDYSANDAYSFFACDRTVAQQKRLLANRRKLESDAKKAILKVIERVAGRK